jgi:hypothetical protein
MLFLEKVVESLKMLYKEQAQSLLPTQTALIMNQLILLKYSNWKNQKRKPKQAENSCSLPYFKKSIIKDLCFNKATILCQALSEQPTQLPQALSHLLSLL